MISIRLGLLLVALVPGFASPQSLKEVRLGSTDIAVSRTSAASMRVIVSFSRPKVST